MTTTISTCGCSSRTSMWRIVVVWIGGAETIASRFVSWRERLRRRRASPRRPRGGRGCSSSAARLGAVGQQVVDEVAVAGVRRNAAGARCAGARAGPAPRARRARCGSSRARSRRPGRPRAPSSPRAGRSPRTRPRPCASSSSWRGDSTRTIVGAPAPAPSPGSTPRDANRCDWICPVAAGSGTLEGARFDAEGRMDHRRRAGVGSGISGTSW